MSNRPKYTRFLVIGDVIVLLLVVLVGFASHNRLASGMIRILATFIPVLASWVLVGVHVGVFEARHTADFHQLWRPFWAMGLAGPLAAWMRAIILGEPDVSSIFVVILGGISALSLLAWRTLYWYLTRNSPFTQPSPNQTNG